MRRALWLVVLCFALPISTASAREAILSFNSDVTIQVDASLRVIETITVSVEGNEIKRGIVREFPTKYKDRYENRRTVSFDVESVRMNDRAEPWFTKGRANGVELYTGESSKFLSPGTYRYEITYTTSHQIGYFDGYDELYWNVTGNGWRLPIDKAGYTLHLPRHAEPVDIAAFTGPTGSTGTDFRIIDAAPGLVSVVTTRPFAAKEGLTVAVSFPTGLVHRPSASDRTRSFFRDNLGAFAGLIGLMIILGYYIFFWDRAGRDPEGGAIIPRFKPPEGFSPAAARFVYRMSYDRKAFSAAVINMAVKGYLEIDEVGDEFTLKQVGTSNGMLTKGEQRIASRLFQTSDQITLVNENHKIIAKAISAFESGLKSEYQHTYFITNMGFLIGGVVLSLIAIAAVGILSADIAPAPVIIIAQSFIAAIAAAATILFLNFRTRRTLPQLSLKGLVSGRLSKPIQFMIVGAFFLPQLAFGAAASGQLGLAIPLLGLCLGIVNGAFYVFLKSPTRRGRSILDEIEGFRLYLATAEKDRLNLLNPPEKTPELFERFLPFALALDVENEWSEQFTDVLAAAGTMEGEYHPRWYHGRRWHNSNVSSFSSGLNSSFATAIASSAVAPGSSSGVGGGGFSGGGGGGGGGGGW